MNSLNFKTKGEGLPIVFIHGFCETSEIWESFSTKIADGFKVITIDLPGFGSSKLNKPSFSIDEIGFSINEWVVRQGLTNSILIGHSLGGYVGLSMVSQNPELFSGLALFHSTARPDTESKKINREKVMEFVKLHGVKLFIDSFIPGLYFLKDHASIPRTHEIASKTMEATFLAYTAAMRDRPSREDVLTLSYVPILIIAGQNDSVIDVESLEEQAKLSSNIRFYALQKVGHMGLFEAENEATKIINDFAQEVKSTLLT